MGIDVAAVHEALVRGGASVACAESLTGGRIAAALTSVGGASRCFRGGVVAYAPDAKRDVLGVPAEVIESDGTVSAACAQAMAEGARKLFAATYAVSSTGVAGPTEEEGHSVGTVFVALTGPDRARVERLALTGDRERIAGDAVQAALGLLADALGLTDARGPGGPREEPGLG